ncbi:hypothetical protein [Solilutibacter silvestris]|uniref:hypothetical protein n=1 Tax=Solilutibacter silvestris TaxID=1645665 RepID=UPI003D34FD6F
MTILTPANSFDDVTQLDTTTIAIGGAGGAANTPLQNLCNRTYYLKLRLDGLGKAATTNNYNDLANLPALGSAAYQNTASFASASDGVLARSAVQPSQLSGYGIVNPITTAGDMIIGGSTGLQQRLPAGTNTYVLTMVGGYPAWAASGASIPNVQTITSAATVTPTYSNDVVEITAQSAGLTIANPTGTPNNGQAILFRLKDNGTAQTIAFGTAFIGIGGALPTTTTAGKWEYFTGIYSSADSKIHIILPAAVQS